MEDPYPDPRQATGEARYLGCKHKMYSLRADSLRAKQMLQATDVLRQPDAAQSLDEAKEKAQQHTKAKTGEQALPALG